MILSLTAILLPALAAAPAGAGPSAGAVAGALSGASPTRLSPPDLAIVAAYLLAITLFGLSFSRKSKRDQPPGASSLKTYFLADNSIPWWALSLSIVSAETSTLTIVSVPGVAFAGNFGFLQIVLGYMLGRLVVASLFLPKYFRGEMLTAYQLIDQRFGPTLHKLTAGLFLLTRAAAEGVRVFAISIVVGLAIGAGDTLSIAIISALTLLYTFEGGMAAVIWTDVVQMTLYVAGTLVALFTLGAHVPGSWPHIVAIGQQSAKFHMLDFTLNLTSTYTFWSGVLGGTFLTMASHGTDQLMVQRMLAARNLRDSRLALLSSGAVIFLQFTLFLLIGAGLFVFYGLHPQTFPSPDRIFPTFIVQEMPHGVAGLLVAAILAAAMSNLSAALNSLASTTVVDFYLPFRAQRREEAVILSEARSAQSKDPDALNPATLPSPSGHQSPSAPHAPAPPNTLLISRAATVFWAFVLFAIAVYSIHAGGKGHVVETGLSIASVAYGCLLGVFLLGTLTRANSKYGATQAGAIVGMICGLTLNLTLWQASLNNPFLAMPGLPKVAFTWYVLIGSLTTFAIGALASLLLPRPRRTLAAATLLALCLCAVGLSTRSAAEGPSSTPQHTIQEEGHPERTLSNAKGQPKNPHDLHPATTAGTFQPQLRSGRSAKPQSPFALASRYHKDSVESGVAGLARPSSIPQHTIQEEGHPERTLSNAKGQSKEPHDLHFAPTAGTFQPQLRTGRSAKPQSPFAPASRYPKASALGLSPLRQQSGLQPLGYAFLSQAAQPKPAPDFSQVSALITEAIAAHKLPGAVVLIGHNGKVVFEQAYGVRKLAGEPGLDGNASPAEPMTPDTIFDMASLTKVLVTTTAILQLYEQGKLDLDKPVATYLPDFAVNGKEKITIRQLLTHYSGLPEDVSLKDDWGLKAPDKAEGLRRALSSVPYGPPGLTFKYSDINFITLGALVEHLSDEPLQVYAHQEIFPALRMAHTSYRAFGEVCGPKKVRGSAISYSESSEGYSCCCWAPTTAIPHTAPTAHDNEGTPLTNPNFDHLLRGTVHDPTARRMGGVAGHAGVFSTAEDAAKFCQALLDKLTKNTGPFPLKQSTLREATSPQAPATAANTATIFTQSGEPIKGVAQRGLGWDLNSPFSRPRGEFFPITTKEHPGSFGHTGFTGTSLWLDPTSDTYVILLANAIHPRGAPPISALRGAVATAAARALGLKPAAAQP